MVASSMADQVGRVLGGRYRLVAPIGTGASAHVYVADDITLRRRVAIKILHAALAEDESFLRRFRAEAQQAAALTHPNIMRVFDWGESGDGPYLVLEHLAGGSLRDMLDAETLLSPSQALLVGLEAARALDYAHRRGLVHRDIKPANLVFDDEGRVCIADFGLARALAEAAWTEPVGALLGTARYASPEQAQGSSVDGKADVYALAMVVVEAVTGRVPFSADTTIATLMARVGARLDPPEEVGPLGPVLVQAADPTAAERLDAGQFAKALEQVARDLPAPEPFRLVRRSLTAPATESAPVSDLTELGRRAGPTTDATTKLFDGASLDRSAGDRGSPDETAAQVPYVLPAARRRRRRWPWLVAIALLAALGTGAGFAIVKLRIPSHPVPALKGLTLEQARAEVADEKFKLRELPSRFDDAVPRDQIIEQDPSSLAELREGQTIELVVSRGREPREVPDLTGLDQAAAEAAVRGRDLAPVFVPQRNEDVPPGQVIDWSPMGATTKGAEITVNISEGPPPREIPELAGRSFDDAKTQIESRGLVVARSDRFSSDVDPGLVIGTNPAAGGAAEKGATVTVVVSKGPDMVEVPNVLGRTVEEARKLIGDAGLTVEQVVPATGRRVVFTNPPPGAKLRRGSGISLFAP